MSQKARGDEQDIAGLYEIRIKGHVDGRWAEWLGGLTLTRDARGETRLTGPLPDQAALYRVLRKVRDLGMSLLSVTYVEAQRGEGATTPPPADEEDDNHSTKGDSA